MEEIYAIHGIVDDVIYNLLGMKEPNYMVRIMATSGRLLTDDTCKDNVRIWNQNGEDVLNNFKYKLSFDWYFLYRHAVENHNSIRHSLPSIEGTCVTDRWECWVFYFVLSISDVNEFLILIYFVYCWLRWEFMTTLLDFCQKFVWPLIKNIYTLGNGGG